MVKIRLKRVGKVKQPSYRVVVADSRSARDGRIIEAIGHYNPRVEPSEIHIDNERAVHWLGRGAQPSDAVRKLLQISGAWSTHTGEAPPTTGSPSAPPATAAGTPKATPAASVTEGDEPGAAGEDEPPAAGPVDEKGA